jgi:hypothetical protein
VMAGRATREWPRFHPADAQLPDGNDPSAPEVRLLPQAGVNHLAADDGYRLDVETLNARRKRHEARHPDRPGPRLPRAR